MDYIRFLLLLLVPSGALCVTPCVNRDGDAYCAATLATYDNCVLSASTVPCACVNDCYCTDPSNGDNSCDCLNYVQQGGCSNPMISGNMCSYTCNLRNSVVECDALPAVPGASPLYNGQPAGGAGPQYLDVVTYQCDEGYIQVGGLTDPWRRVCNRTGEWVLDPAYQGPFSCDPVPCGDAPCIDGATPSRLTGVYGDSITYTCKPGYTKMGGGSGGRMCDNTGLWFADPGDSDPLCIDPEVKFTRSKPYEIVPALLGSLPARSGLHCASLCAQSSGCHGYSFNKATGACELNMASASPVTTAMKRVSTCT